MLTRLADFERIVFLAHYDRDRANGNPRVGWTDVIVIHDLASVAPADTRTTAASERKVIGLASRLVRNGTATTANSVARQLNVRTMPRQAAAANADDVDASRAGRYCRLAAVLYLDPKADLSRYCREKIKLAKPGAK